MGGLIGAIGAFVALWNEDRIVGHWLDLMKPEEIFLMKILIGSFAFCALYHKQLLSIINYLKKKKDDKKISN